MSFKSRRQPNNPEEELKQAIASGDLISADVAEALTDQARERLITGLYQAVDDAALEAEQKGLTPKEQLKLTREKLGAVFLREKHPIPQMPRN